VLISRLLSSTSFRLSAIFAALLVLSFLAAAGGAWLATRTAAMDEAGGRLEGRYEAFEQRLAGGDMSAALRSLDRRSGHGSVLWRLTDADGATLAGDATLPNEATGLHMIDLPEEGGVDVPDGEADLRGDHAVLTRVLPDGARITLALDIQRSEISRDAVLGALLWAGAASVLIALAAGVWATRRALCRMDALAGAARDFGAGDLKARAPEPSQRIPDDIDQLAQGFNQMFDRVDQLVANVRRVSADVAHELRTPLTHVRQKLDGALSAATPEAAADAIEGAQASIDEVLRTFDAMLRRSEIEAGAMRARFAPADVAAVMETVCDAYRPDIEASGRTLTVRLDGGAQVQGDAQLIAQAGANLLENAMRHTPPKAQIMLDVSRRDGEVRLAVSDDGPGVPAPDRARILEPFTQLDESRSRPGAGLGLSIVAAIARLHGAAIRVEDAGPGLRVTVAFPEVGAANLGDRQSFPQPADNAGRGQGAGGAGFEHERGAARL
jgi:signal transduction histidine kinase